MKYLLFTLLAVACGSTPRPGGGTGGSGIEEGTGGATGGSGGRGTGGASPADAAAVMPDAGSGGSLSPDTGPAPDASLPADLATEVAPVPPLAACAKPSVDHLEIWTAHGGSLRPGVGGNLLIKEGERHYMKVEFLPGGEWHEIVVPIANSLAKKADLSASKGFTITYSATSDLWVQLRPLSHPHGGEQHTAKLPATGGMMQELFVPFAPASWGMLLGTPTFPFADAVRDANFFDFVGPPASANVFVVRGLRFDGYVPPCS